MFARQLAEAADHQLVEAMHPASGAIMRQIKDWPKESKGAAVTMLKKYGPPSCTTRMMLLWYNQGPWTKITVHAKEVPHNWPILHMDVLEQTIDYRVPPDRYSALAEFDGSVWAMRTRGELTAHCHRETMNFVAINMAHKVVEGLAPARARKEYEAAAKAVMGGKPPDIAKKLTFDWHHMGVTADPDTKTL